MQYDKCGLTRRRALLGGAVACLGAAGGWAWTQDSTGGASGAASSHRALGGASSSSGRLHGAAASGWLGRRPAHASAGRPYSYRTRPYTGVPRGTVGRSGARLPTSVRQGAHLRLGGEDKRIALTFDDGPHPVHTPAVLDVLRRHGVKATFFVVGQCAQEYPHLVKKIAADGHLVGNHSWSHPQLDKLSVQRVEEELGGTSRLLYRLLGAPPSLARAPYGAWDRASLRICARLGMEPVGWSVDTTDWSRPGAATIRSRVISGADAGAIVLSHDGGGNRSQSVQALEHYLPRLLEMGYVITPVRVGD
ncbi:oligosaccharide deacetylase [Streptomyces sp. NHF165]|nr:oligosaccharide deacetylase [Streptomyces sp. NHF165]